MASTKKEIAKTEAAGLPTELDEELFHDAGVGQEHVKTEDLQTPFLQLIQKGSPQVDDAHEKYIEDAKPGMFINSVTEQLYDGSRGVLLIPCVYQRRYVEWRSRDEGGGLVADHGIDASILEDCTQDERRRNITPQGNIVVDSGTFYCLMIDEETQEPERIVLSLTSTQLKKARKLNFQLGQRRVYSERAKRYFTPASPYSVVRATSVSESNDSGSWKGFKFQLEGDTVKYFENGVDLYRIGVDFAKAVNEGLIQIKVQEGDHEHAATTDGDIPF